MLHKWIVTTEWKKVKAFLLRLFFNYWLARSKRDTIKGVQLRDLQCEYVYMDLLCEAVVQALD